MNTTSAIVIACLMATGFSAHAEEEADLIVIANVQKALEATGSERKVRGDYLKSLPPQSPATVAGALSLVLNRPPRWAGAADMRYPVLDMVERSINTQREVFDHSSRRDEIASYLGALLVRGRNSERFYFLMRIKTAGRLWTLEDVPLVLDLVADGRARAMGVELYRLVSQMNEAQKAKFRSIIYRDPQADNREDELDVLVLTNMWRQRDIMNVLRHQVERYQALGRDLHRRYFPATGLIMPGDFFGARDDQEMALVVSRSAKGFPMSQQIRLAELTLEKIRSLYLAGNASVIEAINGAHEKALSEGFDSWNVAEFFRRLKGEGFRSATSLAHSQRHGQVLAVDFTERRLKNCDDQLGEPEK